jgi:hypothetical protein
MDLANATKLCHQSSEIEKSAHLPLPELPIFERRTTKDRYQVRFWSTQDSYKSFVEEVERNELVIQDVMNNLMAWFTQSSQSGALKHRIIEGRPCTAEQQG